MKLKLTTKTPDGARRLNVLRRRGDALLWAFLDLRMTKAEAQMIDADYVGWRRTWAKPNGLTPKGERRGVAASMQKAKTAAEATAIAFKAFEQRAAVDNEREASHEAGRVRGHDR